MIKHFSSDYYASALVVSAMIRTERRPIVLGPRTFDYYRESVAAKAVKLVQVPVVVGTTIATTAAAVVVVVKLIG